MRGYCCRVSLLPFLERIGVNEPTHYVVKFDCYKINHIYMSGVVDDNCEKVEV